MTYRDVLLRVVGPLGLALSLSACATAQPGPAAAPAASGAGSGPAQPKVNRLVVSVPAPVREGNDPSRDLSPPDVILMRPMYEYLIAISTKDGKFEPQLATSWNLEPDGKSYRFKLRKGVQFHDKWGEMTAKDVAFTLKDLTEQDSVHSNSADHRALVEAVEEVNDYEVVFKMRKPDGPWIGNISMQLSGMEIHSKAQYDKDGRPSMTARASAGTGPYQYKERQQSAYIRYERAPFQHWRVQPEFPELEFRIIQEASTRMAGLLAGEVHLTPLPNDLVVQAEKNGMKTAVGKIAGVRSFLQLRGVYLNDIKDPSKGYKFPDSPLMDVRVRTALSKAINRDELNKTLFGGKTEPEVLNHFHPLFRKGWNPEWEKKFQDEYGYDLPKAKQLVADAGYGPNKPLNITMQLVNLAELPNSQDIQEAIANYWRAAGMAVKLETLDRAEDVRRANAFEFSSHANIFVAPSDQWLGTFIFNTYTSRPPAPNVVHVPAIDDFFNSKLRPELDDQKQEALWRQLGDLMFAAHQHVPLFYLPVQITYNPKIVGEYVFPGSISGLYTHLETVKAAK